MDKFRNNLQGIKIQFPGFKSFTLRKLGNEIVLSRIHQKMKSAGFSQKIIDGTTLDKIVLTSKKFKLHFRSEFFEDAGFDVAVAREEGTKDHGIDAPEPTSERPNPHLMFEINGKKIFAKHVDDKAIPALFIIKTTIDETRQDFLTAFRKATDEWYIANMRGLVVAS